MARQPERRLLLLGTSLAACGLLIGYGWLIWYAPRLLIPQPSTALPAMSAAEMATAAHNARVLVVSLAGAVVVLAGLLYTARNYRLARRGQVIDRFTKALERLGSSELYVRIGAVHALEQVMRDSPEQHGQVLDVLVAFVRDRTPRAHRDDGPSIYPRPPLPPQPSPDVQAALSAIAHRHRRPDREPPRLNLAELHLRRAKLAGAHLEGADLHGTQLQIADLRGAQLQAANLADANLELADLFTADLRRADLGRAILQDVHMMGAQLQEANLRRARLRDAQLKGSAGSGATARGRPRWRPAAGS